MAAQKHNKDVESYQKLVHKKLSQVSDVLQHVAVGNFRKRVHIPVKEDEFTELQVSVNLMIEDLSEMKRDLEAAHKECEKEVMTRTKELGESEKKVIKHLELQKMLSSIALQLNQVEESYSKKTLNKILKSLIEIVDVSRVYIFEDSIDGRETSNTYEQCAKGITPQMNNLQGIPYKMIPSWNKILKAKGIIKTDDIKTLPKDLYKILAPQKIKSIVILPLMMESKKVGFIGFDENKIHRVWDKFEIDILTSVAQVISATYERKMAGQQLKDSEERFRALFDSSRDAIMILDPKGHFTAANQSTLDLFGVKTEKEFITFSPDTLSPKKQEDGQDSTKKSQKMIAIAMKKGGHVFEWLHQTAQGKLFFADVLLNRIHINGRHLVQANVRDISEKKEYNQRLQDKVEELEQLNKLMIGRELKMVELKEEIEKLKTNL